MRLYFKHIVYHYCHCQIKGVIDVAFGAQTILHYLVYYWNFIINTCP